VKTTSAVAMLACRESMPTTTADKWIAWIVWWQSIPATLQPRGELRVVLLLLLLLMFFPVVATEICSNAWLFFSSLLSDCVSCPEGWFQDTTAQSVCKACLPGKRQAAAEQVSCVTCEAGRYSDTITSKLCTECGSGFYQENQGQMFCFPCMVGRVASNAGSGSCSICEEGKYRGESDKANGTCLLCPRGYSQRSQSAVGK